MEIICYEEKFKDDFVKLNKNWIEKYFKIEPHDIEQLTNAEKYIEQGDMIFFAVENGQVISTCLSSRLHNNVWEIAKFASNEHFKGKGAGKLVFKAGMDYAIKNGAEKIVLYSNQILKPALHIYDRFGFKEVPVDIDDYERCDYQAEYIVTE
ncbi:GNAT family N-acetyltransferase [Tetragenococcus koreensis]|nr:GNAT family N-acetyltransferase [Tetragenococcus koreensis]